MLLLRIVDLDAIAKGKSNYFDLRIATNRYEWTIKTLVFKLNRAHAAVYFIVIYRFFVQLIIWIVLNLSERCTMILSGLKQSNETEEERHTNVPRNISHSTDKYAIHLKWKIRSINENCWTCNRWIHSKWIELKCIEPTTNHSIYMRYNLYWDS